MIYINIKVEQTPRWRNVVVSFIHQKFQSLFQMVAFSWGIVFSKKR